jgi:hypothetical protein
MYTTAHLLNHEETRHTAVRRLTQRTYGRIPYIGMDFYDHSTPTAVENFSSDCEIEGFGHVDHVSSLPPFGCDSGVGLLSLAVVLGLLNCSTTTTLVRRFIIDSSYITMPLLGTPSFSLGSAAVKTESAVGKSLGRS